MSVATKDRDIVIKSSRGNHSVWHVRDFGSGYPAHCLNNCDCKSGLSKHMLGVAQARKTIDELLAAAGWAVQNREHANLDGANSLMLGFRADPPTQPMSIAQASIR
jgi:hypothetical protein